jgi:hypothetical protein
VPQHALLQPAISDLLQCLGQALGITCAAVVGCCLPQTTLLLHHEF